MKQNILVTGGFGFLGGHLVDLLTKNDTLDHVHIVDNLSTNALSPEELFAEIGTRANLTYDICSVQEFSEKKPNIKWDQIYQRLLVWM